jgi:hypothetical protein
MVTVLGTSACNEKKHTPWQHYCKDLGLIFDFDSQAVFMSAPKIAKMAGRLFALFESTMDGHLEIATRDYGLVALPGDVHLGS